MEEEDKKGEAIVERWLKRIASENKAHSDYRDKAKEAQEAYDDEKNKSTYPIFWSTIELLKGAIYARTPLPDVRKRNHGKSPSADKVAMAVEQSIAFFVDSGAIGNSFERCVSDFLVTGMGVAKAVLETKTAQIPVMIANVLTGQPEMVLDEQTGDPQTEEVIVSQVVGVEHWPSKHFRWEPTSSWDKVSWICYDHYLTKKEIEKQFNITKLVSPKDSGDSGGDESSEREMDKYAKTYLVHEIWDHPAGKRLWLSSCHNDLLEIDDLPLDLVGKFPTPCPMMDGVKSDELIPDTYYRRISRRVSRLNVLTKRINALVDSIKDVGAYDASFSELDRISTLKDGERVPINNLIDRINQNSSGRASFDAIVADVDNRPRAEVLRKMIETRQLEEDLFFKDTGISDIVRGVSNASETATAQSIKDNWANVRIGPRIKQVANYIRDMYRIMAEIIGNNLEPDQIVKSSGITDLTPEDFAMLKDDFMRTYVIDIETDATVAQNEGLERQQRLEALKTFTDYMNGMLPAVQNNSLPADLMKEMLLFVLGSYKSGRQLEDVVNALPDSLKQLQSLNQQNQQLQQQVSQAQEQTQQLQKQLGDASAKSNQIESGKAGADITLKNAQASKVTEEAKQLAASNAVNSFLTMGQMMPQESMQEELSEGYAA